MEPDHLVAGRYRLLSRLGAGGMGTVWRAHDDVLGREVAVKEVSFPPGLSDADRAVLVERTHREARAAARLHHPSAVTVYDVAEQDGAPFLVMELVEARTLADVVREDGPLSPQRTAEVGLGLLGALEAAHRQGIVHRDVKPSNVMVRDDGRVVLTDFGIATSTGDSSLTSTGLLLGSPSYIAPERARGHAPGPPSDLRSLGATLFTAVEGRPPYEGDEPILTVTAVVTGEHVPFRAAGPLEPVLEGLLEKDPALRLDAGQAAAMLQQVAGSRRPESTRALPAAVVAAPSSPTAALDLGEVRSELAAVPAGASTVGASTVGASTVAGPPLVRPPLARPRRPEPAPERRVGWLVPLAVAALLAAGGGAVWALSQEDPDEPAAAPAASAPPTSAASSPSPAAVPSPSPTEAAEQPSPDPPPSPEPTAPVQDAGEQGEDAGEQGEDAEQQGEDAAPAGGSTTETGAAGWTVALPPGYAQTGPAEYRQASTGRTLRVETGRGQPDAVADRERAAAGFAERHPSYEEIRIEPADYRGYEAADWEFTFEGLHVLNRVFVVDGTGHSLWLQTPEDDFGPARSDFDAIASSFDPAG